MRTCSPQISRVGASISGRRFSSLVLPSGQKARAAASLARVCSIGHSGELAPSGSALSWFQRSGSAQSRAGTSGGALRPRIGHRVLFVEQAPRARSTPAARPYWARSPRFRRRTKPRPSCRPDRRPRAPPSAAVAAPRAPSRDGCRARYARARRRENPAMTARSPCARAPEPQETGSIAASRQNRQESRAWVPALFPHAARKAVEFDRQRFGFAHGHLRIPLVALAKAGA